MDALYEVEKGMGEQILGGPFTRYFFLLFLLCLDEMIDVG